MKSDGLRTSTSHVDVADISALGFWLFLGDRELFVPFREFPWFVDAPVSKILNVQRPQEDHLFWPDLDVDLSVESIEHPERFPLMYRERAYPAAAADSLRSAASAAEPQAVRPRAYSNGRNEDFP